MAKRSSLRASDADRDRVADRLHEAATEGRLLAYELEERLATALRARTYGELDALLADLPGGGSGDPSPTAAGVRIRAGRVRRTGELAVAHPVAAILALVAATVAVCVVTAFVLATIGIWMVAAVVLLFVRAQRPSHRGRRPRYGRPPVRYF